MKTAISFLAVLLLVGSLAANASAAYNEDETDGSWQAHIQDMRNSKQAQD
jgi:outer membrane biogenesis lipoprotein LolB